MRIGAMSVLDGAGGKVEEIGPEGERVVRFEREIDPYRGGEMPLPPYIDRAADAEDETRYQTVFARVPGAVAAPTAGLHFTTEILAQLPHTFVTLHVGTGTFRPVQSATIAEHRMHAERFTITDRRRRRSTRRNAFSRSGRLRCGYWRRRRNVTVASWRRKARPTFSFTRPYEFRAVDRLLTNFHLPRSTLLMLVAAFAGREFILRAYAEAVRERYRFYSYGDCMLIL